MSDAVLARFEQHMGAAAGLYRNHVYRGMNYQMRLLDRHDITDEMALAWAVHDLGIWSAGTWDYLAPSLQLAAELSSEFGVADHASVCKMVELHHKIRSVADDPVVEAFRLADRADAWKGRWRGPLTRTDIRQVVAELPYLGFHRYLGKNMAAYVLTHPFRPAPMFRW